jgi:putative GTP pyrophosphokinase
MPPNGSKTQDLYDAQMKDWKNCLVSIARKLSRQLDREHLKYSMKRRIKHVESLQEAQRQSQSNAKRKREKVKDLLGLRVVVPFQEDVEKVREVIERHFEVLEIERKAENLSFREFAYDSVHVIIGVSSSKPLEFPPGCLKACEVQVRTILQDAWAEVEHELIYKSNVEFPDESVRKKLAALNASLTLSDTIFQEIRDYQKELGQWGRDRFHELRRKAAFPETTSLPGMKKQQAAASKSRVQRVGKGEVSRLESTLYLALKAHNEKDHSTAIQLYSRVLKMKLDLQLRSLIYNHRGMARFMLQEERKALGDFERSVQCDSRNYRALNNRALLWRRLGHVQESLKDFARSLEITEKQPEVRFMRAQTFVEIGDFPSALRDVKTALELQPNYPEAEELRARIRRIRADK